MSRTGWLPVTAIALLATVVIAVLAAIGQARKSESAAFFQRALHLQSTDYRTVNVTGTGTVTMLNGDVHSRHTEGFFTYDDDQLIREWYDSCTYPHAQNVQRCSTETVQYGSVHYQKVNTSDGEGKWEEMSGWGNSSEGMESGELGEVVSIVTIAGDVMELERETVDGVTYRRYRVTRHPGEETLRLINSGEWVPQEAPEGFPDRFTVEEYIDALREMFETQLFTEVYWIREDSGEIRRVERRSEKTYEDDADLPGALLPQNSIDVTEYYRHSVTVEIRPPS